MSVGRQPGKPGWLATVVNLTGGTARRLVPAERRGRRRVNKKPYSESSQRIFTVQLLQPFSRHEITGSHWFPILIEF